MEIVQVLLRSKNRKLLNCLSFLSNGVNRPQSYYIYRRFNRPVDSHACSKWSTHIFYDLQNGRLQSSEWIEYACGLPPRNTSFLYFCITLENLYSVLRINVVYTLIPVTFSAIINSHRLPHRLPHLVRTRFPKIFFYHIFSSVQFLSFFGVVCVPQQQRLFPSFVPSQHNASGRTQVLLFS